MDFYNPLCSTFVAGLMSRAMPRNLWTRKGTKTPHIRLTSEQVRAINVKVDALNNYRWDNESDIISHAITINKIIQELIWDGYRMDAEMGFYALRNSILEEWHGMITRVWLDTNTYRALVLLFLDKYITIGATKTSSLGMNGSWRRQNARWRHHTGIKKGFPSIPLWAPDLISNPPKDLKDSLPCTMETEWVHNKTNENRTTRYYL